MRSSRHLIYWVVVIGGIIGLTLLTSTHKQYERANLLSEQENNYRVIKKDCGFAIPWPATVTCGELHTPKSSGEFFIAFAILHDDSPQHKSDPVVYLQGGPGAGARIHKDGIASWLSWMNFAQLNRDIILVDTRGTGRSRPAINCSAFNNFNRALMRKHLSLKDELAQGYDVTTACFKQLAQHKNPITPDMLSTHNNAEDIRALIGLLGYEKWNLLGVSYGTRLALEIARQEQREPQTGLNSMVLDSVYPAGYGGVQTWPQVLGEAMQQFFDGCSHSAECNPAQQSSLQLRDRFVRILHELQEQPIELTVTRWDGGAPVTLWVNDHRFLSASFAAIYNPQDWLDIMTAINGVEQGRSDELKSLIEPYINNSFNADFNSLTFMAIDCADNPIRSEQDYLQQVARFPLWENYTRDQWRYQICHAFTPASSFVQPLTFEGVATPSLMLAGRLDPITPVAWAEEAMAQLPQSQLIIRDQLAHSVLSSDTCLLENLHYFFDAPTQIFTACDVEKVGVVK